jgi:hypothetical protein
MQYVLCLQVTADTGATGVLPVAKLVKSSRFASDSDHK